LLGQSGERRSPPNLLDDPVGAALGFISLLDLVDGHENLGHARFGLSGIAAHATKRVVDFGLRDLDLGAYPAAHDLGPGDARLNLLHGDLIGHADALQVLPKLPARHARRALDLGHTLVQFGLRDAHPQPLGVLDLQPLVDHLPQDLGCQALVKLRAVLHAGAAHGKYDTLVELVIGDGVVIDPRHHAQPLCGGESGADEEGDCDEGAEDERGH
jgi:hypothetical protein